MSGRCDHGANCGCKCTAAYLRKHGFAMNTSDMTFDIDQIHDASHAAQDAALLKKDVVATAAVQCMEMVADACLRLELAKLNGVVFQVVVPAGAQVATVAPEILKAGGYLKLLELKLLMPDGQILGEEDKLPKSA